MNLYISPTRNAGQTITCVRSPQNAAVHLQARCIGHGGQAFAAIGPAQAACKFTIMRAPQKGCICVFGRLFIEHRRGRCHATRMQGLVLPAFPGTAFPGPRRCTLYTITHAHIHTHTHAVHAQAMPQQTTLSGSGSGGKRRSATWQLQEAAPPEAGQVKIKRLERIASNHEGRQTSPKGLEKAEMSKRTRKLPKPISRQRRWR